MCQLGVRAISTYSRCTFIFFKCEITIPKFSVHSGGEIVSLDRELTGIVFAINLHPAGGQVKNCIFKTLNCWQKWTLSALRVQVVGRQVPQLPTVASGLGNLTFNNILIAVGINLQLKEVVGRLVIQDFWQTRERDFFFLPTGVYRCVESSEGGLHFHDFKIAHRTYHIL